MLVDTTAQSNLLANVCASRAGENQLGGILLDGGNLGASRSRANVNHNDLVLGELGNLGLLSIGGPHTKQTAEEIEVDLDLTVDLGETALEAEDETDQTIGSAKGRVDAGSDTNQATRDGVLEIVGLRVERHDAAEDGRALESATVVTGDDTRTDLNLIAKLDDTVQDTATSDTALQVIDLSTRLVDVEGSNDDHVGVHGEVSGRDGDGVDDGLVDGIDVELELGGDGDDRRLSSNRTTDKLKDRLVVLLSGLFPHEIDLVLQDDNLVQLHNLNSGQMLRGLRLGTRFVASDEKQGSVHDGGTRQHGAHENIVTRAVDETRHVSYPMYTHPRHLGTYETCRRSL